MRVTHLGLRLGIALAAISLVGSLPTQAQPAPAAPAAAGPRPTISRLPTVETFQLANGLKVAVLRVDSAPVVAVQVWYHAGSKDEPRDRRGSAHMFEHMMFKGTAHVRPEAHAQFLNGIGGYVNAATDEDATHYINTVPAEYLDFAIQLEAERMRNLLFRPDMIATEKEVVKEEIRQQENSPIAKGFLRFLSIAFRTHPYAWTAGGTIADLDATTPEDLQKFYDTYYQPNNALLVVVGKATVDQVKALAERYFGPIAKPAGAEPPRPSAKAVEPEQSTPRKEVVEPSQLGLTLVGWHVPAARDKDIYALQVASIILGAGESSRIKLRIKATDPKSKQPLGLDGGMEAVVREDPGMVIALGAYLEPAQAAPVEAAIFQEVAALGAKGPSSDELRKAKNQVQSAFVLQLEHAQGLAEAVGRSWILTGDPGSFMHDVDAIEKVTAADVTRVVKQYMRESTATTVTIPPRGSPASAPAHPEPTAPTATPKSSSDPAPTPTPTPAPTPKGVPLPAPKPDPLPDPDATPTVAPKKVPVGGKAH